MNTTRMIATAMLIVGSGLPLHVTAQTYDRFRTRRRCSCRGISRPALDGGHIGPPVHRPFSARLAR